MIFQALIVLLLILLNGFFALSEMAVVTARPARLKAMAETRPGARRALELSLHPERFLSTVQIGITLIPIVTGMLGGSAFGEQVAAWIAAHTDFDDQVAGVIGVVKGPQTQIVVGTKVAEFYGELEKLRGFDRIAGPATFTAELHDAPDRAIAILELTADGAKLVDRVKARRVPKYSDIVDEN